MSRKFNELINSLKSNFIESENIFQIILMFQKEYLDSTEKIQTLINSAYADLKAVNNNAEEVVGLVDNSSKTIKSNIHSSKTSITAMTEAADSVNRLDEGFSDLKNIFSALTSSITEIIQRIDVIEDISELTNLLALNAAIEAARAGEKGKGFQVVAKEIRNLADRSRTNTSEITSILQELTERLDSSRTIISNYGQLQNEVLNHINETNSSLSTSTDELELINSEIGSINTLVEQQAESTASLLESLDKVNKNGEFTIENAPYIDNAVQVYNKIIESNTVNITGLDEKMVSDMDAGAFDAESLNQSVIVGHDIAYPPWCYIKDGQSAGISIERTKQAFSSSGVEVNFKGGQWINIYNSLHEGSVDLIANVGWPSDYLKNEPLDISEPYESFKIRIFARFDETVDVSRFSGKRIGVQKGSFSAGVVEKYGGIPVEFENDIQGMVQLLWNNIDGVATEEQVGSYISENLFMGALKPVTDVIDSLDVVYIARRGSGKIDLLR